MGEVQHRISKLIGGNPLDREIAPEAVRVSARAKKFFALAIWGHQSDEGKILSMRFPIIFDSTLAQELSSYGC